MSDNLEKALLPAGMRDVLAPDAEYEASVVERLMTAFARHGYERVKPPLLEFEDGLLAGSGQAMATQTFRLMDPVSHRMVAVRPDMTLQVARIAATRLTDRARPLRLSYAGQVLRVKGSQLRPSRQFGQVGAELIGSAASAADAEVILMAAEALAEIGIPNLTVDLGIPTLVPAVLSKIAMSADAHARVRQALDRKDAAAVEALESLLGGTAAVLARLLGAGGPAADGLKVLSALDLGAAAKAERDALAEVAALVGAGAKALGLDNLRLTVDPVENRGFEYHTGVTFTFFAAGVRGELGSGGRYRAGNGATDGEPATGLTLFMDTIIEVVPPPAAPRRLFLPAGTPPERRREFQEGCWITVSGLDKDEDTIAAARRLGCDHVLIDGRIETVTDDRR